MKSGIGIASLKAQKKAVNPAPGSSAGSYAE
jgi:hypothetical protein